VQSSPHLCPWSCSSQVSALPGSGNWFPWRSAPLLPWHPQRSKCLRQLNSGLPISSIHATVVISSVWPIARDVRFYSSDTFIGPTSLTFHALCTCNVCIWLWNPLYRLQDNLHPFSIRLE
jgi:hypothetical protein